MSNRHDEGFSSGFGFGYDPSLDWEGPHATRGGVFRDPSRSRRYHFEDEMGSNGFWSGFTGRGGMTDRFYERSPYDRSFNAYERNLHDRNVGFYGHPYERNVGFHGHPYERNVGFYGHPYERNIGNVGFFGTTPSERNAALFGMMSPFERNAALFGMMSPFERNIANAGFFGTTPFERNIANAGFFGTTPFDRHIPNVGLLGLTPFERNAALFGMTQLAGMTPFERNIANAGLFGMNQFDRNVANMGLLGMTPFERNAAIFGMTQLAGTTPWERNHALFGTPFTGTTSFDRNFGIFTTPWERNLALFGTPFAQNVGHFGTPFAQNVGLFTNPWDHRTATFAGHPYDRAAFAQSHLGGFANTFGGVDRFSHLNDPSFNEINQGWNTASARSPFFGRDRVPFARNEHDFWPVDRFGMHGFGADAWGDSAFAFGDERGPHFNRGPKGYKRPDERIREEVCDVIARQGFIDASDVEVVVENGVVRLVGSVAQRREKRALEQIIERIHGVEEVRNELRLNHNANAERFQSRLAAERQVVQPHNGKNARA